jgi:hypothetical protein
VPRNAESDNMLDPQNAISVPMSLFEQWMETENLKESSEQEMSSLDDSSDDSKLNLIICSNSCSKKT